MVRLTENQAREAMATKRGEQLRIRIAHVRFMETHDWLADQRDRAWA